MAELVMVIEDEKEIRELVRYNLERAGYRVHAVGDGEQGLEQLMASRPDVLVLDLILPGMDGFEVIRRLRLQGSRARILILTNRDDHDAIFETFRLGADGFLEKTAPLDEIIGAIEEDLSPETGVREAGE